MKKHDICSNWQIVFMSDNDKQTLIGLHEVKERLDLKEVYQIS